MGYGFPAAVAAKIVHPDRPVVCFAGDGCFLMASQELATAVRYELPVIVVLVNNDSYGSIRMHQEREYPGRVFATGLQNPGLRGAREVLWRLFRAGLAHGRLSGRVRARRG